MLWGVFNHRSSNTVKTQGLIPLCTFVAQEDEPWGQRGQPVLQGTLHRGLQRLVKGVSTSPFQSTFAAQGPSAAGGRARVRH